MNKDIATYGPFKVSVELFLTDGEQIAKAGIDLPPGVVPTAEAIDTLARAAIEQVGGQLEGFYPMGRHAFVNEIFHEMEPGSAGIVFSVPGPDEFDADWAKGE